MDPADCDWPGCGCDPAATRCWKRLMRRALRLSPAPPLPSWREWIGRR
jgi:hypothetical protein